MRLLFRFVVLPLLVLWVVRIMLRSIFGGMNTQVAAKRVRPVPTTASAGGELKKDPAWWMCSTA